VVGAPALSAAAADLDDVFRHGDSPGGSNLDERGAGVLPRVCMCNPTFILHLHFVSVHGRAAARGANSATTTKEERTVPSAGLFPRTATLARALRGPHGVFGPAPRSAPAARVDGSARPRRGPARHGSSRPGAHQSLER